MIISATTITRIERMTYQRFRASFWFRVRHFENRNFRQ